MWLVALFLTTPQLGMNCCGGTHRKYGKQYATSTYHPSMFARRWAQITAIKEALRETEFIVIHRFFWPRSISISPLCLNGTNYWLGERRIYMINSAFTGRINNNLLLIMPLSSRLLPFNLSQYIIRLSEKMNLNCGLVSKRQGKTHLQ